MVGHRLSFCDNGLLEPALPVNLRNLLKPILCLSLVLFVLSQFWICAAAESIMLSNDSPVEKKVPKPLQRWFHQDLNHIFAFDSSPLGHRIPVILLPGRAEEAQYAVWWKKFKAKTERDPDFDDYYKLYIFMYDSGKSVEDLTDDFVKEMRSHFGHLPEQQHAVLVSYSLGGLIALKAMEVPDIFGHVARVFGIASPYHGSPLFTPAWFIPNFHPRNHSPICRVWDYLVYRSYIFNKANLTRGLQWDNFDTSGPPLVLSHDKDSNTDRRLQNEQSVPLLAIKSKLIVYAGYLENTYVKPPQPKNDLYSLMTALPADLISYILPSYLMTIHSVFEYMNIELADMPVYPEDFPSESKILHLFRYNDGAIPLSSALFLPPRNKPYDDDVQTLIHASDVSMVRVFAGMDHMALGEFYRRKGRLRAVDIVHPQEGSRTSTEWVLYDLKKELPLDRY
jgi:pimeloyl-ACP methyl ester carboxylesterase